MWIKICGIQHLSLARQLVEWNVDALGFNFYQKSVRYCDPVVAKPIVQEVGSRVEAIGLFVNASVEEMALICQQTGIRTVQLHGDETPQFIRMLLNQIEVEVIRVFRMGAEGLVSVSRELEELRNMEVPLKSCLIDAKVEGSYGGTGRSVPWELLKEEYNIEEWPPLILAGGLNPGNVSQAIRMVDPWGIDVASGVESEPGVKSLQKVEEFIKNAREETGSI